MNQEEILKHYRRTTHLMEKIRVMIAKDEISESGSVFYSYVREARESMDNIIKEIEKGD